jgi:hypothetical protein
MYVDTVGLTGTQPADPFSATGEDWMQYDMIPVTPVGSTLGTGTPAVDPICAWSVDVRSQRKVEELQQTLYMVMHNLAGATDTFVLTGSVSVLLRLP